jgi:hypothetical protein
LLKIGELAYCQALACSQALKFLALLGLLAESGDAFFRRASPASAVSKLHNRWRLGQLFGFPAGNCPANGIQSKAKGPVAKPDEWNPPFGDPVFDSALTDSKISGDRVLIDEGRLGDRVVLLLLGAR